MNARVAPRRPAAQCPWITGVRLHPVGGLASLVDISWSGVKVTCGVRIKPGSHLTVAFDGTLTPARVHGRVARCEVGGVGTDHLLRYNISIVFDEPLSLPDEDQSPAMVVDTGVVTAEPVPEIENRW